MTFPDAERIDRLRLIRSDGPRTVQFVAPLFRQRAQGALSAATS